VRRDTDYVLGKLAWMQAEGIWPNGLRYLWTDAFGVVLYVSLYRELGEQRWLDSAEALVAEVDRVLGRERGLRIGEAPDRDGQYFHYLAMWMFSLVRLGEEVPRYRTSGIQIAREVHPAFVLPSRGVVWKMEEDLSAPYPSYGLGAMDAFDGYISYCLLGEEELTAKIAGMKTLMDSQYSRLDIDQDLGLGMMLWLAHFFPQEAWAKAQRERSLAAMDRLWTDPPGFFARASYAPDTRIAFANYGISLGLQAAGIWQERVLRLNDYFDSYFSDDEYDPEAITHVMACTSHMPGAFLR
tara:strand:- start:1227 stop:2117 length:891 start_codon:yes stop_codon:yes gene_type:complete